MVRVKDFDTLFTELTHRKPGSGTDQAIAKGIHHLGKKVIEEAGEVLMASKCGLPPNTKPTMNSPKNYPNSSTGPKPS